MTSQDDDLVRRYREASAQDNARPGAHVRDAVLAHAQLLAAAAATAPPPAPPAPTRSAANQSRWKISALATVALVGLTGLLMLQFERGTPEERDIAFGQRRAQAPAPAPSSMPAPSEAPAADATSAAPTAPGGLTDSARDWGSPAVRSTAQKPAAPTLDPARPLAQKVPSPAPTSQETQSAPGRSTSGAVSGFPASPSISAPQSVAPRSAPQTATSPPPAPRAEMSERSAIHGGTVSREWPPSPQAPAPAAKPAARSMQWDNAETSDASVAAPQANKARGPTLPQALRDAARAGNASEVERLIGQGAPVDARDTAGRTALMIAALNGHNPAVQKLLTLGAQKNLVDGDGLSASQHARRWGYMAIADLIDAAR